MEVFSTLATLVRLLPHVDPPVEDEQELPDKDLVAVAAPVGLLAGVAGLVCLRGRTLQEDEHSSHWDSPCCACTCAATAVLPKGPTHCLSFKASLWGALASAP